MDLYELIKLLHILLVIVAVGFNASYAIWIARAASGDGGEHLAHVLRTIRFVDNTFANPAYALLLVTGLAMVFVASIPLTTFWIAAALVLYVILLILGIGFYSPALRRQIAALESDGASSQAYRSVSARASRIGVVTMLPVLAILFLMVIKPTL